MKFYFYYLYYLYFNTDLSHKHVNAFIYTHHSLYDASLYLARGCNRVAVLDNDNRVVNIISQSSVIHFLNHHVLICIFSALFIIRGVFHTMLLMF